MFNLILLATFVFGLFVRLCQLTTGIDYDEAYSYLQYMSQPLLTLISKYNIPNNHILNSFIGWMMVHGFGPSPLSLRFPALLAGILCFPIIFLFLRNLFDKTPAFFASCFCFLTWPFVYYSAQARGYIYQILFIYFGAYLVYLALKRSAAPSVSSWLSALCFALALWAIPTSLFPLGFLLLFLLWSHWDQRALLLSIGVKTGLITFLLYFPAIIYVGLFGTIRFHQEGPFTWEQGVRQINYIFNSFFNLNFIAYLILLIPFIVFVFKNKNLATERKLFVAFLFSIAAILFFQPDSMNYDRLWIWALPLLSGFLFSGFLQLGKSFLKSKWTPLPCFIVFSILVWNILPQLPKTAQAEEHHTVSLYRDLQKELKGGDYVSLPQALETELDYWHRVHGGNSPFLRFVISGDWHYSIYRLSGEKEVLRRRFKGAQFYILETKEGDLERGKALFKDLHQSDQIEVEELRASTKRAKIWKVVFEEKGLL